MAAKLLIEDLYSYEIKSHVDQEIQATIHINEQSTVYKGHFPEFAITPGVCQVLMIKEVLEGALRISLRLSEGKSVKFTSMHEPGRESEIDARITYARSGSQISADGMLYRGETRYLKIRCEFIEQP
jgi:3-hydroxyacyl-[acyl-carrier-protein] dehydratase